MKNFTKKEFLILGVLVGLCIISFLVMLFVYKNKKENVEVVEVPASTEDRYTGKRDGKWYIDGQEVDKTHYDAYIEMTNENVVALDENLSTEDNSQTENTSESKSEKTSEKTTTKTSKKKTSAENKSETSKATTNTSASTGSSSNTVTQTTTVAAAGSTSQKSNASTSGSASQKSNASTSGCDHNWKELTTTIHHEAVYQTVVTPAVYANYYCRDCGTYCVSIGDHSEQTGCSLSNWTGVVYGAHLLTPEKREQKLIKEAYDEQVGTGVYECTKCHAKK